MKSISVSALATLLLLTSCQQPSDAEQTVTSLSPGSRPNILLIVADDLGYQDLGIFGGDIDTPNIDALFNSGVMLTQFYTALACQPTRAMLMSGTSHHQAGVGAQGRVVEGSPIFQGRLSDGVASIAERMSALDYHTSMVGKWHLGSQEGQVPADRGFERSFIMHEGGAFHFDLIGVTSMDGVHYEDDGEPVTSLPDDYYSTISFTDHMISYIEEANAQDRPFFGYVAYTAPHWPIQALDEDMANVRGRYDEGYDVMRERRFEHMKSLGLIPPDAAEPRPIASIVPWDELSAERQAAEIAVMEAYAAMVERMDREIGRMVARLEAMGELDNTLIMFMSDNGAEGTSNESGIFANFRNQWDNSPENIGRRDSWMFLGPGWGDAGATSDFLVKASLAQGGIHAPAAVSAPGLGLAPGRSDALIAALDIAPTFVELAGGTNSTSFDGRDVLPMTGRSFSALLRGEIQATRSEDEALVFEHGGQRAVFKGDWKALWIQPPNGIGDWQLFNLAEDPGETSDLASDNPQLMAELAAAYEEHAVEIGLNPPGGP